MQNGDFLYIKNIHNKWQLVLDEELITFETVPICGGQEIFYYKPVATDFRPIREDTKKWLLWGLLVLKIVHARQKSPSPVLVKAMIHKPVQSRAM